MPAVEKNASHRADVRRMRTDSVNASRRRVHLSGHAADGGRVGGPTQADHVTPNAIIGARGSWSVAGVKRFARWLTDGATDRPHLRF